MCENRELPEGWKWVKLGEEFSIISGSTPKGLDNIVNNGPYQFYKVSDMNLEGNEIQMKSSKFNLNSQEIKKLKIKIYPKGTTIFPKRGGAILTNKKRLLSQDSSFDLNLMGIIPKSNVQDKYLFYWMEKLDLGKICDGSNIPQINNKNIFPLDFPLAPIVVQKEIVSKIEELFSELDKGIENLIKSKDQIAIFRKSIISAGVSGKLTESWRNLNPDFEHSEILYDKIQNKLEVYYKEVFEMADSKNKRRPKDHRKNKKYLIVDNDLPDLPYKWKYYRLEDISYLVTDGTHFTPKYQKAGVKFLSVKNIRPFYFRDEAVKYISQAEHKLLTERCNPEKNDILYTKIGATFGYAAKITTDYEFSIFVSLCLIKPVYEFISSSFLEILMNSELVFKQARKRVSGSGVPDLHLIEIRDFKIPLPSLAEQEEIVKETQKRLSIIEKMETDIVENLKRAEVLRQCILKKAFEGKLI